MDEGTIHVDRTSPGRIEISPALPGLRPSDPGVGKIRIEREGIVYRGSRGPRRIVCAVANNCTTASSATGGQIPSGSRACCRLMMAHRGGKITARRNAPALSAPPIHRMDTAPTERRMVCGRKPPKGRAASGDMNPTGVHRRRSAREMGEPETFRTQFRDFQEMRPPTRDIRENKRTELPGPGVLGPAGRSVRPGPCGPGRLARAARPGPGLPGPNPARGARAAGSGRCGMSRSI